MNTASQCPSGYLTLALLLACQASAVDPAKAFRPGVWAGNDIAALPLPASGYQVYFIGEMHGLEENESLGVQYMVKLHQSALRDVAIEEDAVYGKAAQDYVDGLIDAVPEPLCLRAGVLIAIRRFNEGRIPADRVRVHLVDIDTPADAIRQHLIAVQQRIPAARDVSIPPAGSIKHEGLKAVEALRAAAKDPHTRGELRTIEHSIRANQQGLEVGTGSVRGSPYLEDREQAIASNIHDLVRRPDCRGVLALYGADHVSKSKRKDGGPDRNAPFAPLALRLQDAGVRVFSIVSFPLSGHGSWRGRRLETYWTAKDAVLTTGETLDKVLAEAQNPRLIYIDRTREKVRLPSQDATGFNVEAYLLIAKAEPMPNHCPVAR